METVNLGASDRAFIRKIEEESGQVVARCYQCGNCTAGCPMDFAYDYPVHRVMRLIQAGRRETVLSCKSIWLCATCETCTARCPNNIDVATILDVCRHMARREKYPGVYNVRTFATSFLKTVELFGRAHELGLMAAYMLRTGRVFTDVDLVPKILPKGKLSIMPHTVKARKEVADIFRRFKEGEHEK